MESQQVGLSIPCIRSRVNLLRDDGHQDISERIAEMEKSDTYAGQPEILTLVHVIKRPIAVHYMGTNKSTLFGEAYQESADTVHLLNYPDRG